MEADGHRLGKAGHSESHSVAPLSEGRQLRIKAEERHVRLVSCAHLFCRRHVPLVWRARLQSRLRCPRAVDSDFDEWLLGNE